MTHAHWGALRPADLTSRRTVLAAALALATHWGGTPGSDAKRQRKRPRKKTCGRAGVPPIKGQCCAGAQPVDGVCQACHVCGRGCRFSTVQGAIDAANAGDTIVICPGTYVENLTIERDVRLIGGGDGAGVRATTLRGAGTGPVVTVKTGLVALHHLHITGGRGDGSGIANLGATLGVTDCIVSGNLDLSANGGGIYNAGALILNRSTVSQNAAAEGGGMFTTGGNAEVQLINSNIRGNRAVNGGGLFTHDGANVLVDAASRVTANVAEREGGGLFASLTAGRVDLASRDIVMTNTPSNCEGAPVDFCSGI